jgi:integrase
MPKKAKELSALEVSTLTKPGLFAVGSIAGLHLQVKDSGARSWILRKKIGQRRSDIGLGGFPDTSLKQARIRAREIDDQIRSGIDPLAARREVATALKLATAKALTFEEAAKACFATKSSEFKNLKHKNDWLNSVVTYASRTLGKLPIREIELAHIVNVLKPLWLTKTETATRLRQRLEAIIAWATVSGYRTGDNPARWKGNLEHVLPKAGKVRKVKHHAALPWANIGAFMVDLRKAEGMGARALEFAILTAARSGEVRGATWDEFDLVANVWTIPAERMKTEKAHRVPLSDAALQILTAIPRRDDSPYVFASIRGKQLSDMTISAVTRRMGVDAVPHGFRSTFKDWCRTSTRYADEVSELALAHVNSDETRAAYARDELLAKRALLMRDWAKYCGTVRHVGPAIVVAIHTARKDGHT